MLWAVLLRRGLEVRDGLLGLAITKETGAMDEPRVAVQRVGFQDTRDEGTCARAVAPDERGFRLSQEDAGCVGVQGRWGGAGAEETASEQPRSDHEDGGEGQRCE